jgi:lauroyl/myristoyl acyltransferase
MGRNVTHRSFETVLNSAAFSGLVCIRKLAVRTNCPTVALNPARNALNGYTTVSSHPCMQGAKTDSFVA